MRIHERIDKIRYFQLGGAGGIEQNPLSHTCASAPLDSPEHVDPQSADHVNAGPACLFTPRQSYGCYHHSEYTVKHTVHSETHPASQNPARN